MLVDHPTCDCPACGNEPEPERKYKGHKDRYTGYYGRHWEEIREIVLGQYDWKCADCRISNQEHKERNDLFPPNGGLHIHHMEKAWKFDSYEKANDFENLVPLCADCHRDAERG